MGWQRAATVALVGSTGTLLAVPVLGRDYGSLLLLLVIGGGATAIAFPATNLALSGGALTRRHVRLFVVKQLSLPLTAFAAGASVPAIVLHIGWRWAFVAAAVLPALSVPLVWGAGGRGRPDDRSRAGPARPARVLSVPLLAMALAGLFGLSGIAVLNAFLVTSSVDSGMSPGSAGVLVSVANVTAFAAMFGAGFLVDRDTSRVFTVIAAMLGCAAAGFFLLSSGPEGLYVAGAVLAYAAGWAWTGLFQFSVVLSHPHAPASASGVTETGLAVGAAAGPLLFGVAAGDISYGVAWVATGASAVVAACLMLVAGWRLALRGLPRLELPV